MGESWIARLKRGSVRFGGAVQLGKARPPQVARFLGNLSAVASRDPL